MTELGWLCSFLCINSFHIVHNQAPLFKKILFLNFQKKHDQTCTKFKIILYLNLKVHFQITLGLLKSMFVYLY